MDKMCNGERDTNGGLAQRSVLFGSVTKKGSRSVNVHIKARLTRCLCVVWCYVSQIPTRSDSTHSRKLESIIEEETCLGRRRTLDPQ